jgi:manganese efflux pump family protein
MLRSGEAPSLWWHWLVVALALGLNNFGAAIAIGVSGVDRLTGLRVAAVFGLWDVVIPAAGLLTATVLPENWGAPPGLPVRAC